MRKVSAGTVGQGSIVRGTDFDNFQFKNTEGENMLKAIYRFMKEQEGASAAEYALLVGLITVAMAATVTVLGNAIINAIGNAAGAIAS